MRKTCLVVSLMLLLSSCLKQELQTGLTEAEAQEITVLLKRYGIDSSKVSVVKDQREAWTVYVRGGEQNLFLASRILQEHGMPRERAVGLAEVFSNSSLIPTASEEKARLILGLSGEMAKTLRSVPGVIDVRVHVVLPEDSPLVDPAVRKSTTASVLIKYKGQSLPLQESEVKALVAKGIEGLRPENVAVVFKRAEPTSVSSKDLRWSLGAEEITLAGLVLLLLSSGISLVLVFANRRERRQVKMLKKQLALARQNETQVKSMPANPVV